ncbi:MAG: pitrilysin family protein [Candidatus Pacearchaeota archaeon]
MRINKKILKNGLTIIHEKRDVPVTTVMLAVKYGAANEDENEKGLAHFIEHMCFKGTEKRSAKEIAEEVEKLGGDLNAFTSEEITAYHVKLPSEHLGVAMDVIFDVFFNPIFPNEDFFKEANVICEEIKMYNDNPRAHVLDEIKCCLYERPFGMFIGGTEENVKRFSPKMLLDRHRSIYTPSNSILCVVGDNEFNDVVRFAERFCIEREGGRILVKNIKNQNLKKIENRMDIQQANIAIGFHFPKLTDKDRYAAEIFSTVLGDGMSSKLFTEVREKRGLVYNVKTEMDAGINYGYLVIFAGTDKSKIDEVINICIEEFGKMKEITEKELEQAKIQAIGGWKVEQEGSSETALNLIIEETGGNVKDYYSFEEKIKKVNLEDIKKLADKIDYGSFILSS